MKSPYLALLADVKKSDKSVMYLNWHMGLTYYSEREYKKGGC